jgi:hypothetical protein
MHRTLSSASLPLFATLLTGLAAAQTPQPTIPTGFERSAPGNSTEVVGWQGFERIQVIYHPLVLAYANSSAPSRVYTHLFLRAPFNGTNNTASFDVTVTMACSGVPLPAQASTTSFAANVGSNPLTTVLTNVSFPATQSSSTTVVDLPLQTPLTWANGEPLLIQLDLHPLGGTGWTVQMQDYPVTYWLTAENTSGQSCPASPSEQLFLQLGGVYPPQEWIDWVDFTSAPASLPAALFVGLSNQHFGGFGLPLNLGVLGAPGCFLQTSVQASVLGITQPGANGSVVEMVTNLPRVARLAGLEFYGQVAVFDPQANAAGLRLSQLGHVQLFVPPEPDRTRYSQAYIVNGAQPDVIQNWVVNRAVVFDTTAR